MSSKAARGWLLIVLFLAIGMSGAWLFASLVSDNAWRETFYMVWWIPAGLAAAWLANTAASWITAWTAEESAEP